MCLNDFFEKPGKVEVPELMDLGLASEMGGIRGAPLPPRFGGEVWCWGPNFFISLRVRNLFLFDQYCLAALRKRVRKSL